MWHGLNAPMSLFLQQGELWHPNHSHCGPIRLQIRKHTGSEELFFSGRHYFIFDLMLLWRRCNQNMNVSKIFATHKGGGGAERCMKSWNKWEFQPFRRIGCDHQPTNQPMCSLVCCHVCLLFVQNKKSSFCPKIVKWLKKFFCFVSWFVSFGGLFWV